VQNCASLEFGTLALSRQRHASGHPGSGKKKKSVVSEGPPIANVDVFAAPLDHTRMKKKDEEGRGEGVTLAVLLLTRVVAVRSIPGCSRRLPAPGLVADVAAFESCMPAMRTERGLCLRPPEKSKGLLTIFTDAAPHLPGCSARPSEPNIIAVLREWRVEPGAGSGGRLGSQEG
jgi:hypothetical protein